MKKILLLNFPWKEMYIREYYCSKTSKADYYAAPIDLVMLSWILNTWEFELKLIDSIIERLDENETLKQINDYKPDLIIWLIGSVSLVEDRQFLEKLLEINCEVFLTGDVLLTEWENFLREYPKLKWIITKFVSDWILKYLKWNDNKITDLIINQNWTIKKYPIFVHKAFEINLPIHNEFIKRKYSMPFVRNYPFATTLMTYGCPFQCSFCIMSKLGYKERPLDNIIQELDYLKSLWVREILFLDQTLGINKTNFKKLLEVMIEKKYNFWWFGFSRVDVLDRETMELAKKAGCHTLWFGIESGNQFILDTYRKWYNLTQIREGFKNAKEVWIKTLATFIIWLPEETYEMALETIKFACEIDPDFASFNFAVPRYGTDLRNEAEEKGLLVWNMEVMDQSGNDIAMWSKYMTKDQVQRLRKLAVYKFYLRPSYIFKRFSSIRSMTELKWNIKNAYNLLINTFIKWN